MGLMFNPNSLYKFPRVLKKKEKEKRKEKRETPADLLFPTLTVIAIQPESLHFLGLLAQLELQGKKLLRQSAKRKPAWILRTRKSQVT